jgi:hypothetical protein
MAGACALGGVGAHAQNAQPLGTIAIADADVTTNPQGVVPVSSASVKLAGSSTITAKEGHNAELSLARGGNVLVCQTSVLHATPANDSLLLALDRGAMEIHMKAAANDVVMTPDMRMTMSGPGELDLRMRVTFNGDTCVENHGRKAPALNITDAFGEASYQVKAGQHVMFEHGSLREVVDRETTPCGCPPMEKQGVSIADALLSGKKVAAAQPFPAAQSEGLAAPAPEPPETPGSTHVQLAATLTFDPNAPPPAPPSTVAAAPPAPAPAPSPSPSKGGPFRAVGRFFKRIFAH